jgi:hypothetical protein
MSGGFLRFAGRMGNMASICEKIDKGVAGNKLDQPINPQKKRASSIPYEGKSSHPEFVEVYPGLLLPGKRLRSLRPYP